MSPVRNAPQGHPKQPLKLVPKEDEVTRPGESEYHT
jgi:hypothetical protein